MIERYRDHAANERTFLAWVRTAIATMAFGFLVEKFNLFLKVASRSLAGRALAAVGQAIGNAAGLALIVLGGAMMVLAAVRFRRTACDIDSPHTMPGSGVRLDLALTSMLLLGAVLFASCVASGIDSPAQRGRALCRTHHAALCTSTVTCDSAGKRARRAR